MSSIREEVRSDMEYHKKMLAKLEEKAAVVAELPLGLQDAEGYVTIAGENRLLFTFYGGSTTDIIEKLRGFGLTGEKPNLNTMTGSYYLDEGKLTEIGFENSVTIYNAPQPTGCKVIAYQETVTRYKEECGE